MPGHHVTVGLCCFKAAASDRQFDGSKNPGGTAIEYRGYPLLGPDQGQGACLFFLQPHCCWRIKEQQITDKNLYVIVAKKISIKKVSCLASFAVCSPFYNNIIHDIFFNTVVMTLHEAPSRCAPLTYPDLNAVLTHKLREGIHSSKVVHQLKFL